MQGRKRVALSGGFDPIHVGHVRMIQSAAEMGDVTVIANSCATLLFLRPDIFANGGDRKEGNIPEYTLCEDMGIEMKFGVGGDDKPQSSSWLIEKVMNKE